MPVKGSKSYRPIVVPYHPVQRLAWVIGITLFVGLLTIGSFWYGYHEAQRDYRQAIEERAKMQELTSKQAVELQVLSQQVSNTRKGSEVDHQTMEGLRQEILELNEQIAQLEQSNHFYRQLMEPEKAGQSLHISSWQVTPGNEPRHFTFELIIQNQHVEHRLATGKVNVSIVGQANGVGKTYSLHELSSDIQKPDIPFKLRFYQTFSGKLVLPEGFEPARVDISAEKSGSSPVSTSFDWNTRKSLY